MEKKDLLKTWQNKIVPSISRHLSIKSFVQDVVSPFLHILMPPTLRPVISGIIFQHVFPPQLILGCFIY